jgi:predicted RNase H-like HicB family nuclease
VSKIEHRPIDREIEARADAIIARPYTRFLFQDMDDGGHWYVRVPEWDGCMSDGDTPEEALENVKDAMFNWVYGVLEDGLEVPEPANPFPDYSGRFVLRLPRSLHRQLAERADAEGVSLNTLCLTLLAGGLGVRAPRAVEEPAPPSKPARRPRTRAVAEDSPPYEAGKSRRRTRRAED